MPLLARNPGDATGLRQTCRCPGRAQAQRTDGVHQQSAASKLHGHQLRQVRAAAAATISEVATLCRV